MAKLTPNQPCPCGSEVKFKRCCWPYLSGDKIDNAERLLKARYVGLINKEVRFVWDTLHPNSPRKLHGRWPEFEAEYRVLAGLDYRSLKILDAVADRGAARIVHYVTVCDGAADLSYVEEAEFRELEGVWYYYDGLRRSSARIGCVPESVRLGELKTLFIHTSDKN